MHSFRIYNLWWIWNWIISEANNKERWKVELLRQQCEKKINEWQITIDTKKQSRFNGTQEELNWAFTILTKNLYWSQLYQQQWKGIELSIYNMVQFREVFAGKFWCIHHIARNFRIIRFVVKKDNVCQVKLKFLLMGT